VDGVSSLYLDHGCFSGRDGFTGYYGCLIVGGGPPPPLLLGLCFGLVLGVCWVFGGFWRLFCGLVCY
jgi:hypothetical protein